MPAWLIWLLITLLLAIGEVLTPGMFFLGPLAIATLAASVAALVGFGLVGQLVVFAIGAVIAVGILRPVARRHMRIPGRLRTGTDALVGTKALVLEKVDLNGGRVKIGGEVWSARAYDESQVLEPGRHVEVAQIEGATALVYE